MPLSWGEDVVGWVNCTRRVGILDVGAGYVTGRDRGAGFARAFDDETARLAAFLPPVGAGGES